MFGFGKKEKKSLWIMSGDVVEIIKSDYDEGTPFFLIDFNLESETYTMGSEFVPDREDKKENIYFIFEDKQYDTVDGDYKEV